MLTASYSLPHTHANVPLVLELVHPPPIFSPFHFRTPATSLTCPRTAATHSALKNLQQARGTKENSPSAYYESFRPWQKLKMKTKKQTLSGLHARTPLDLSTPYSSLIRRPYTSDPFPLYPDPINRRVHAAQPEPCIDLSPH